jgi:MazG family protein
LEESDMRNIDKLLDIMAALRDPQSGCPWDIDQNFASIAPYTIEEAYEVADAIDRDDMQDLREELGDLLLQVVFHSQMAKESELFDFDDVAGTIAAKMLRRHPHVFNGEPAGTAEEQHAAWEAHKAAEQAAKKNEANKPGSVLDGVTGNLPALTLATKTGKKAARVGFDWDSTDQVIAKVQEELDELEQARQENNVAHIEEELGDLLLATTNLARHLHVDPEQALRQANRKFSERFRKVETQIADEGGRWDDYSLEQLEAKWQAIKEGAG